VVREGDLEGREREIERIKETRDVNIISVLCLYVESQLVTKIHLKCKNIYELVINIGSFFFGSIFFWSAKK